MSNSTKASLKIMRFYEKTCVYHSDKIIVPSEFLKDEVLRFYNVDEDKIFRIYNGVDTSLFRPQHIQKDRRVLFFTGGSSYRKGADVMIESFVRLKRQYPDLQLVVSGSNSLDCFKTVLEKNELKLGYDVVFMKTIPYTEMPYYYNLCDVFVMPSHHETFCTAVVEAMACGKPVVVANTTALPEVVGDCGLMAVPGDVDSFVDAISKLLDSPALRVKLGRKARARAQRFFSLDRVILEYESLFKELV